MSKIIDALEKINSEDLVSIKNNKVIQESTLLLQAPKEDTTLLTNFGIDHQIRAVNKITALSNRQTAIAQLYGADTYTGKQIEELCCKYYLKLLPISYFRGNIPIELSEQIKTFAEKNNIVLTGADYKFFILAPYDQFTKERFEDDTAIVKASKIKSSPILFFREHDRAVVAETDHVFTKVYTWSDGNFSWLRGLKFLFNTDDTKVSIFPVLRTWFAMFLLTVGLLFGFSGHIFTPVVLFASASLVIYSNLFFNISSDILWNRTSENHK